MTAESTIPYPTPASEDDVIAWLRLWHSHRVGPVTFTRLLREHGSAQQALQALPAIAEAAGLPRYTPCCADWARAEWDRGRAIGAELICLGSRHYPQGLDAIPDPPPLFWARGQLQLLRLPKIALVGARNASSLGTRMARGLAGDLAQQGQVIVSGLARGIDTAAHHAALKGGTIAVLAGGLDVPYPGENAALFDQIGKAGVLISERAFGLVPRARDFPRRNRLVSGLSQAVVVIEAAARSGSLLTARNALDQGREVLAVPGHPFDARSEGCNMLIRDGARLVRHGADVLEALPEVETPTPAEIPRIPPESTPERPFRETAKLHQQILNRLGPSPLAEDQLIRDLDLPARVVAPALVDLEMSGQLTRQPGGLLSSCGDRPG